MESTSHLPLLFALERAVYALIATHPHPEAFGQVFAQANALAQLEQIGDRVVAEDVRAACAAEARLLSAFVDDVVQRRRTSPPR